MAEGGHGADGPPGAAAADPAAPRRGPRALTRLDLVTLVLAWSAGLPDVAMAWESSEGPFIMLLFGGLVVTVVNLLILVGTAALAQSVLGPRSVVRWYFGRVPRRYHVVVLAWFVCVVAAPLVTGFEGLYLGQGFTGWRTMGPGLEPVVAIDPAVTGTIDAFSLLARVAVPVLLLVMRTVDIRRGRRRSAADATGAPGTPGIVGAVGTPGAASPPVPMSGGVPWTVPSLLDTLLIIVVWCAPPVALALKMMHIGWGLVMLIFASPFLVAGAVHALWVFTAVLGARSRVRARYGTVPVAYRLTALGWAVAVVLPGLAFAEFGAECLDDDCGWAPASALESMLGRRVPFQVTVALVVLGLIGAVVLQAIADAFRRADAPWASRRERRREALEVAEAAAWPVPAAPRPVWLPGPPSAAPAPPPPLPGSSTPSPPSPPGGPPDRGPGSGA